MINILVTGCAGFFGSHVCCLQLGKGYGVIGVDNFHLFYSRSIKKANLNLFKTHKNKTILHNPNAFEQYFYMICLTKAKT